MVTTTDSFHSHAPTSQEPILFQSLEAVFGTAWREIARYQQARTAPTALVTAYEPYDDPLHGLSTECDDDRFSGPKQKKTFFL